LTSGIFPRLPERGAFGLVLFKGLLGSGKLVGGVLLLLYCGREPVDLRGNFVDRVARILVRAAGAGGIICQMLIFAIEGLNQR
jgi:hypothetical protein